MDRFLAQYQHNIAQNVPSIHELLGGRLRFAVDIYGNCFLIVYEYAIEKRGCYIAIRSVSNEKNNNRFLYYIICKGDLQRYKYANKIDGISIVFYRIISTNELTKMPSLGTLSYKHGSSIDMFEFDMQAMIELYSSLLK